eukprot:COSAG01_NODE_20367_length_957_cov_26.969697_1_plen_93_part_01
MYVSNTGSFVLFLVGLFVDRASRAGASARGSGPNAAARRPAAAIVLMLIVMAAVVLIGLTTPSSAQPSYYDAGRSACVHGSKGADLPFCNTSL